VKLPAGYRYSSTYAGIRKVKKPDLALIVSDTPASAAAVFTQNRVQAAPVRIARFNLEKSRGRVSAVLINAGNANCATRTGDRVAIACCDAVAKHLRVPSDQVFPASSPTRCPRSSRNSSPTVSKTPPKPSSPPTPEARPRTPRCA